MLMKRNYPPLNVNQVVKVQSLKIKAPSNCGPKTIRFPFKMAIVSHKMCHQGLQESSKHSGLHRSRDHDQCSGIAGTNFLGNDLGSLENTSSILIWFGRISSSSCSMSRILCWQPSSSMARRWFLSSLSSSRMCRYITFIKRSIKHGI